MERRKRVVSAWDIGFHKIVERARQDYSKQIGKELKMTDVTRIWGEGKIARFKYPKLRFRK